jgi:hypothetical protein
MNKAIIMDRQENVPAGLSSPSQPMARHTLKIEELGDPWRQEHCSGIRLKGKWLAEAGFRPGQSVAVAVIAPGFMELRSMGECEESKPNL